MKLSKIIRNLDLEVIYINDDPEIIDGHCGDLLSEVMKNAPSNSIWITHQAHENIIAVASIKDIKAIVIAENLPLDSSLIEKAKEQGISLFKSKDSAFNCVGKIYELLKK